MSDDCACELAFEARHTELRAEVERMRGALDSQTRAYSAASLEADRLRAVLQVVADGEWVEGDPLALRDMARQALRDV